MKILKYIIIGILLIGISGCAMTKHTRVILTGDKIKVPLGSVVPVEGENIKMELDRTVTYGQQAKEDSQVDN